MSHIHSKKMWKSPLMILLVALAATLSVSEIFALPTGPTNIDPIFSSRYPVTPASDIPAIAGNVSELNFESNSVTNLWQGYFGNITGSIKLGDVNNNSLYDWTSASPSGEIYATRSAVAPDWANIRCANESVINQEDTDLNVNQSVEKDSVNRTFLNTTAFTTFYVGNVTISGSPGCYAAHLNDESGSPSSDFQEVLLSDGAAIVYTALISQNTLGFDNTYHDFQMIVGEDGHNGDSATTPYYFYLELG